MKFRDPETGEFKELYTKAADTLPVGTEVDFDGDEVPAGWEEIYPVIESGSNENGNWIKWADGTMICTSRITKNVVNNTEWHNFYISDIAAIPFAQPFKVLNSCQVNLFSQKNMWKLTSFIPNLRESGSFFIISPESFEGTVEIHVEAIGRWK